MILVISMDLLLCVTLPMSTPTALELMIILMEEVEESGTFLMGPARILNSADTSFYRTHYYATSLFEPKEKCHVINWSLYL